ncbi:hypothetical protein QQP08_011585 [Theobroma cacao]|nr:hypothetical protein QQP08_011585 [Theobroma cacao]
MSTGEANTEREREKVWRLPEMESRSIGGFYANVAALLLFACGHTLWPFVLDVNFYFGAVYVDWFS